MPSMTSEMTQQLSGLLRIDVKIFTQVSSNQRHYFLQIMCVPDVRFLSYTFKIPQKAEIWSKSKKKSKCSSTSTNLRQKYNPDSESVRKTEPGSLLSYLKPHNSCIWKHPTVHCGKCEETMESFWQNVSRAMRESKQLIFTCCK